MYSPLLLKKSVLKNETTVRKNAWVCFVCRNPSIYTGPFPTLYDARGNFVYIHACITILKKTKRRSNEFWTIYCMKCEQPLPAAHGDAHQQAHISVSHANSAFHQRALNALHGVPASHARRGRARKKFAKDQTYLLAWVYIRLCRTEAAINRKHGAAKALSQLTALEFLEVSSAQDLIMSSFWLK